MTIFQRESRMPSLAGATEWLNSEPLTSPSSGPRRAGRLLDVHLHQLAPHAPVRPRWAEATAIDGLVVVGVHTPEFAFEHDLDSVRREAMAAGHRLPGRRRQRLRDLARVRQPLLARAVLRRRATGVIRHHHFGEGRYEQSERVIQQLLGGAARRPRHRRAAMASRPRPTGTTWHPRDVPRLRAHRELRIAGRRRARTRPRATQLPTA